MDKKGSHIADKQKRQTGGSSSDIPKPTDGLHKTFVVREEDEADSGKDKMSVCGSAEVFRRNGICLWSGTTDHHEEYRHHDTGTGPVQFCHSTCRKSWKKRGEI